MPRQAIPAGETFGHAEMIAQRVRRSPARHGLAREMLALRTDLFRVPRRPGDQLALF